MRVTQFTQYNNFVLDQQRTLNELNNVQTQISTGVKIQNMYEDPVVYTKYLKLNEEVNSFSQIKSSATFAQTFANETDTVLNDFVSTLGSFKTNLLKAANDTNDETSRNAIVSELEGELAHLKDLANTSIDGKYLFSGSKFNTKPIDDNYEYQGNSDKVKAFLGAGVEREYNIDGASLFLGRDNDYSKHVSTNVVQYDKMKANPQFVVRGADGNLYIDKSMPYSDMPGATGENEPVTGESQIRMLTGVEDIKLDETDYQKIYQNYTYSDTAGVNYNTAGVSGNELVIENFFFEGASSDNLYSHMKDDFNEIHLTGKDTDGNDVDTVLSVNDSTTMDDLISEIQNVYGDVDVSFADGKIHITDNSGNQNLDVSLTTQQDGVKTDSIPSNYNSYMIDNAYFDTDSTATPLYTILGSSAEAVDGSGSYDFNMIHLSGTDTDGKNVDVDLSVDDTTTLEDLMQKIKDTYGDVDVQFYDGKIKVTPNSGEDNLKVVMTGYNDTDGDNQFEPGDDKRLKIFEEYSVKNKYEDGTSYFYVKGKKPGGELIDEKFSLKNSDSVNDLLEKIGEIYGNTPTSKVVDVSLNDMGEIQIKDIQTGKMVTDFYMVASDADENSLEDLVKNGDYIVDFQKSNFNTIRNLSSIQSNHDYFDNRVTKFGAQFKTIDTKRDALPSDTLYNVLGEEGVRDSDGTIQKLDHLVLSGVDTNGFEVDEFTLDVDENTTMQDLMDQIKDKFGDVSVSLENGELIIHDNSIENATDTSNLKIKIDAMDADDNSLQVFAGKDAANFQKIYMNKSGNEINSNVSQIVKDYKLTYNKNADGSLEKIVEKNPDAQTYATEDTVIADTMGTDEMPQTIDMKFRDINGSLKTAKVEMRDSVNIIEATYINDRNNNILIDPNAKSDTTTKLFDVTGSSVTTKEDGTKTDIKYVEVTDGTTSTTIPVDSSTTIQDIIDNSNGLITGYSNGAFVTSNSNVKLELHDENNEQIFGAFMSNYQIDANNDGIVSYGEIFNIYEPDGSLTPAHDTYSKTNELDPATCQICEKTTLQKGLTYRQLADVSAMLTSNNISTANDIEVYNKNLQSANSEIDAGMDDKGRFYLKDKQNNPSDIELSMYTENNSLYFQANDAVTVDQPEVDFFDSLQKAIDAVKEGINYPDSNADDPRNSGIQGAIESIDHLSDHVRRSHAKIGAVSNEFGLSIERTDMLTLNVQQLQSDNIDTDLGEATMRLNSLQTSYQALLASIAKVNNLTLLNYL